MGSLTTDQTASFPAEVVALEDRIIDTWLSHLDTCERHISESREECRTALRDTGADGYRECLPLISLLSTSDYARCCA